MLFLGKLSAVDPEYAARLVGAYRKYAQFDLHPENAPEIFKGTISYNADSPAERVRWNSNVARGQRMNLEQAVRYAIGR